MPEFNRNKMPASNWLWIIILALLFITAIVWFVNPMGRVKAAATITKAAPSTQWAPAATGPAVPVNLPTTLMTNAPVKADSSSGSAASH